MGLGFAELGTRKFTSDISGAFSFARIRAPTVRPDG